MGTNWFDTPKEAASQKAEVFMTAKARREPREAGIRLLDGSLIEGTIHILPYGRPMDLLNNQEEPFLAVTAARISLPAGETQELEFVAVNKKTIAILYELKQLAQKPEQE